MCSRMLLQDTFTVGNGSILGEQLNNPGTVLPVEWMCVVVTKKSQLLPHLNILTQKDCQGIPLNAKGKLQKYLYSVMPFM